MSDVKIAITGSYANSNIIHDSPSANIEHKGLSNKEIPNNYTGHSGYGVVEWTPGDGIISITCKFALAKSILDLSKEDLDKLLLDEGTVEGGMNSMVQTAALDHELFFNKAIDLNNMNPNFMVTHTYSSVFDFLYFWESYMNRVFAPVAKWFRYLAPTGGGDLDNLPLTEWETPEGYNRMSENYIMVMGLDADHIALAQKFLNPLNTYSLMLAQYCPNKDLFRWAQPAAINPATKKPFYGYYRPEIARVPKPKINPLKFHTCPPLHHKNTFLPDPRKTTPITPDNPKIVNFAALQHVELPTIDKVPGYLGLKELGINKFSDKYKNSYHCPPDVLIE